MCLQHLVLTVCYLCRFVRMAYLAIVASHSVNGVAAIHSEIIKNTIFKDFADFWPQRFQNKTNGVTPRRWLAFCNPPLRQLISNTLGTDEWINDLNLLQVTHFCILLTEAVSRRHNCCAALCACTMCPCSKSMKHPACLTRCAKPTGGFASAGAYLQRHVPSSVHSCDLFYAESTGVTYRLYQRQHDVHCWKQNLACDCHIKLHPVCADRV